MTLGEKIKKIRRLRSLTQQELANKLHIVVGQIRNYEIGFRNPKPQTLSDIANALEVGTTVLTDIDITCLGDVKAILFQLNEKVGIKLVGEVDESGKLIEDTIAVAFENDAIQTFLKEWADKQYAFNQLDKTSQEKASAGEIIDIGFDYEYETYTQYDSNIIVSKENKGLDCKEFHE